MTATVVWNDTDGTLTRGCPDPTVVVPPEPGGARYPGDPGVGKIRLGATDGQQSIVSFDAIVFGTAAGHKKHATTRLYNNDSGDQGRAKFRLTPNCLTQLRALTTEGRMPMWSVKPMETVGGVYGWIPSAQILNGNHDDDLKFTFDSIDTLDGPVFGCVQHEPEDDYFVDGTGPSKETAAQYRAIYQYVLAYYKAHGHTNIAWHSPFFMAWTLTPGSKRNFRDWHPNWTGTAWVDNVQLDGFDFYNPQAGISAGDVNQTWATQVNRMLNARAAQGAPALPWLIGEMGLENYYPSLSSTGITVPQFMLDMVNVGGATQDLVAVCLWNNDHFAFTASQDPGLEKTNGWKIAVARPNVVTA